MTAAPLTSGKPKHVVIVELRKGGKVKGGHWNGELHFSKVGIPDNQDMYSVILPMNSRRGMF